MSRCTKVVQNSCIDCTKKDNMNMVQCDDCDGWSHYVCARVGPEIRFLDWSCRLCRDKSIGSSLEKVPERVSIDVGTETLEALAESAEPPQIDTSVGVEGAVAASPQVDTPVGDKVFRGVKEPTDLLPVHLILDDDANYDFYKNKLAKLRGPDMHATVKEISQNLISDEVLQSYSYLGRRKKLRFKDFDNLTRVIISATIESMHRSYYEKYGMKKKQSKNEKAEEYAEVENYFTKEFIKKAPERLCQLKK